MSIHSSAGPCRSDAGGCSSPPLRLGPSEECPLPPDSGNLPDARRRATAIDPVTPPTQVCGGRLGLLAIPVLLSILGCVAPSAPTEAKSGRLSKGGPGRVLQDEVGRLVRAPLVPQRIISLAPSVTETLFALGAGDRVVGVTDFCDYPAEARRKPRIGGMVNPNWEAILRLNPDLLVASTAGNDRSVVSRAEQFRLPVYFLDVPDLVGLQASLRDLGSLVGSPEIAGTLLRDLTRRLEALDRRVSRLPRQSVLFLVWGEPIVVPGRGTFLDDALRRVGCDSVTSDGPAGWPTFDLETLILRDPRWILGTEQNAVFLSGLDRRAGWREMEAVRRGRIRVVNPALERPGPRVIEAMEQLRELLERE